MFLKEPFLGPCLVVKVTDAHCRFLEEHPPMVGVQDVTLVFFHLLMRHRPSLLPPRRKQSGVKSAAEWARGGSNNKETA